MHSAKLISTLRERLDALAAQIEAVESRAVDQSRFDRRLFLCRGTRLDDYLAESRQTLDRLAMAVNQSSTEQVGWLAQRLLDQMTALAREAATQNLRRAGPTKAAPVDYYARLAEHQEYERRLIAMIRDRESLRANSGDSARQRQLQQEIAALEGRLGRCRQALARIERLIERRENGANAD